MTYQLTLLQTPSFPFFYDYFTTWLKVLCASQFVQCHLAGMLPFRLLHVEFHYTQGVRHLLCPQREELGTQIANEGNKIFFISLVISENSCG